MSTNYDSLRKDLEQIRDERATHANTAQRIGNALLGLLQVLEQKLYLSRFLRRDIDDKAEGHIRFLRGLTVGSGTHGMAQDGSAILSKLTSMLYSTETQSGFGLVDRGDGKYRLDITDLMVWGKAIFHELEIRKLSYAGGNVYLSGAGSKIVTVQEVYYAQRKLTGWKCYILADDGTMATQNYWKVGDQVRCQTFGVKLGVYEGVQNHYYWRVITEVSSEAEEITDASGNVLHDGKRFDWIVIAKDNCEVGSDAPAADDVIVLDGCQDPEQIDRQGVLMLESTGPGTPRIVAYKGVDNYTHDGCEVFCLSPYGTRITSTSFEWVSSSGQTIHVTNYRGVWQQGVKYDYYDQVNHVNAVWLCTNKNGTTLEPSDGCADWFKQLAGEKGDKGDKGEDGKAYQIVITSSAGTVMLNGTWKTVLTATLLRNGVDISDTVSDGSWSWRRLSADMDDDVRWNALHDGIGRICNLSRDDIARQAQFECEVLI